MYRILAIDDEPSIRKLMQKTLAGEGYECLLAATAEEGVATCAQGKPDLILLDVNLPDGNGIEVCRRFKGRADLRHIPILLVTGEANTVDNKIDGLEAGAEDYIVKPFLPMELVSRIKSILKVSARPTR